MTCFKWQCTWQNTLITDVSAAETYLSKIKSRHHLKHLETLRNLDKSIVKQVESLQIRQLAKRLRKLSKLHSMAAVKTNKML